MYRHTVRHSSTSVVGRAFHDHKFWGICKLRYLDRNSASVLGRTAGFDPAVNVHQKPALAMGEHVLSQPEGGGNGEGPHDSARTGGCEGIDGEPAM